MAARTPGLAATVPLRFGDTAQISIRIAERL